MAESVELARLYTSIEASFTKWTTDLGTAQVQWDRMATAMERRAETHRSIVGRIFGGIGGILGGVASGIGSVFRSIMAGVGLALGGRLLDSVTGLFDTIVMGASHLNEVTDAVARMAGTAMPTIDRFATDLQNRFGLAKSVTLEAQQAFLAFGLQLGLSGPPMADFVNRLTQMAADLSSTKDISVETAAALLRSALAGETEPLRKYGIALDENTVKSYAYRAGIAAAGKELTEQQKIQARTLALSRQMQYMQGNLAETSGSFANQYRRAMGSIESALISLGDAIAPLTGALMRMIADAAAGLASYVRDAMPQIRAFAANAAAWVEGMRGRIVAAFWQVVEWVRRTWDGFDGWIADLTGYSGTVQAFTALWWGVVDVFGSLWSSAVSLVKTLMDMAGSFATATAHALGFGTAGEAIRSGLQSLADYLGYFSRNWDLIFERMWVKVREFSINVKEIFQWIFESAWEYVKGFFGNFSTLMGQAIGLVGTMAKTIVTTLADLAKSLGTQLPEIKGPKLTSLQAELDAIDKNIADREREHADQMKRNAEDAAKAAAGTGAVPGAPAPPAVPPLFPNLPPLPPGVPKGGARGGEAVSFEDYAKKIQAGVLQTDVQKQQLDVARAGLALMRDHAPAMAAALSQIADSIRGGRRLMV